MPTRRIFRRLRYRLQRMRGAAGGHSGAGMMDNRQLRTRRPRGCRPEPMLVCGILSNSWRDHGDYEMSRMADIKLSACRSNRRLECNFGDRVYFDMFARRSQLRNLAWGNADSDSDRFSFSDTNSESHARQLPGGRSRGISSGGRRRRHVHAAFRKRSNSTDGRKLCAAKSLQRLYGWNMAADQREFIGARTIRSVRRTHW